MSADNPTSKRMLFRVWITLVFPIIPLWLLVAMLIHGAPEYWSELKDFYRMYLPAFKKGEPL